MPHIQWKDRYNIHFREIDAQHRGLLDLLNELIDCMDGRRNPEQVARIFRDLGEYAGTHFSSEERYMLAAKYPKFDEHRREHDSFTSKVSQLAQAYDPGDPHLIEETLSFLKQWYVEHITKVDQEYAPFLQRALPTAPIQAILVGLDSIFCACDGEAFARHVAEASGKLVADTERALQEDPGLLSRFELGGSDTDGFVGDLSAWAGSAFDAEALARAWTEARRPVAAMTHLARGLRDRHQVALVGNAPPWARTHLFPTLAIEGLFHAEVLSCEVGKCLPDADLLLEASALLKVPPEACLLLHNDTACLDAAQAVHLQTLHFTKPVMLMAELRRMAVPF